MASLEFNDGPGVIEGLEGLKTPQSAFTFVRRERPPPIQTDIGTHDNRIPLNPKLKRRESKGGGLRGMFTRNKTEKNLVCTVQEELTPQSATSELTLRGVVDGSYVKSKYGSGTPSIQIQTPTTPSKPIVKPSRMNLRSKSVKAIKTPIKLSPKSNTKASPNRPTRTSAAWDPPPLFQAYPQAIKHAQLAASALSADSILRISNHRRNDSLTEYVPADGQEQSAAARKIEKARNKHRRQISGSITRAEWTQKIFVLVTSGYLLQYSGEGSFDRLPEKMMQLGKDSVAFASDVIPGKHWVLQISQSMDADGTPTADPRSFLSRLTFRNADYRRTTTSLLLILDSAEEMDLWLAVVRREIESLGGKKHVSETGRPKAETEDVVMQLKSQPSHRYLVQRDTDHNSTIRANSLLADGDELDSAMAWPQLSKRPSLSNLSITNSIKSQDGRQLDELRNSGNRLSFMSSGQRTYITSRCSSPERSPTRDSASTTFEDVTPKMSLDESRLRPNASAISERRRSMQILPIPILESQTLAKLHRHSTYGQTAAPNFSVPNSSSRRFSSIQRNTNSPFPSKSREDSTPKGFRKAPPVALDESQPLTTVEASPVQRCPTLDFTPTNSSFEVVQPRKASVVDIPPRSPLTAVTQIIPPQRRSSLIPISPHALEFGFGFGFQFPKPKPKPLVSLALVENVVVNHTAGVIPSSAAPTADLLGPNVPSVLQETSIESAEQEVETLSPLPNIVNAKAKIRRPISMQLRENASLSRPHSPLTPRSTKAHSPSSNSLTTPKAPVTSRAPKSQTNFKSSPKLVAPSLQRLRLESNAKALANRKSMPILVGPPAPPPDCALPPLPPSRDGRTSVQRTSVCVI